MAGKVTVGGVFAEVGGVLHRLPPVDTPLRDWIERAGAAGELAPCPHCGEWFGCDCVDWLEWMLRADTPLDMMTEEDIPY